MATPITWRNVANTVTGNPASALDAAARAFTTSGESARKNVEAIQKREELDREQVNRAASGLFLDEDGPTPEDLASLEGQDIDFAALYGDRSRIDLERAQTGLAVAQTGKVGAEEQETRVDTTGKIAKLTPELQQMAADLGYTEAATAKLTEEQRVSLLRFTPERQRAEIGKMIADANYLGAQTEAVQFDTVAAQAKLGPELAQMAADLGLTNAEVANIDEQTRVSLLMKTPEVAQQMLLQMKADVKQTDAVTGQIQAKTTLAETVERDATIANTALTRARTEGEAARTVGQINVNNAFEAGLEREVALHDANLRGLDLAHQREAQVITQEGKRFTEWEKQNRVAENTQIALAKLASMTSEQLDRVNIDPEEFFSDYKDVNAGVLVDFMRADRSQRSELALNHARQLEAEQDTRWKELTQTPKHAEMYARSQEIDAELRNSQRKLSDERIAALQEERATLRAEREKVLAAEQTTKSVNEGFQAQVSKFMEPIRAGIREERAEIMAAQESGDISPIEAAALIADGEELKTIAEEQYREGAAPLGFLQDYMEDHPEASMLGLQGSEVYKTTEARKQEAANLRQITHAEEQARKTKTMELYENAASGGDLSAFSYNATTGEVRVLEGDDRKNNQLSLRQAELDILAKAKEDGPLWLGTTGLIDWAGRDNKLPPQAEQDVKDLWNAVGKNKEIWNQVIELVNYNIQLGREDKVENIPTSGEILEIAERYKAAALERAKAMGEGKYEPATIAEQIAKYRSKVN